MAESVSFIENVNKVAYNLDGILFWTTEEGTDAIYARVDESVEAKFESEEIKSTLVSIIDHSLAQANLDIDGDGEIDNTIAKLLVASLRVSINEDDFNGVGLSATVVNAIEAHISEVDSDGVTKIESYLSHAFATDESLQDTLKLAVESVSGEAIDDEVALIEFGVMAQTKIDNALASIDAGDGDVGIEMFAQKQISNNYTSTLTQILESTTIQESATAYLNDTLLPAMEQKSEDEQEAIRDLSLAEQTNITTHAGAQKGGITALVVSGKNEIENLSNTKSTEIETLGETKKSEITTLGNTKKDEINTLTTTKKVELDDHTYYKKIDITNHTNTKISELTTHTNTKKSELNVKSEEEKLELDSHTGVKIGEVDSFVSVRMNDLQQKANDIYEVVNTLKSNELRINLQHSMAEMSSMKVLVDLIYIDAEIKNYKAYQDSLAIEATVNSLATTVALAEDYKNQALDAMNASAGMQNDMKESVKLSRFAIFNSLGR